jgi:sialic acid synthase SpsE
MKTDPFPTELEIDGRTVGGLSPCYFIAEIGLNHNGSLTIAKKLIDAAAEAGASAVKFQKRDVNSLAIGSVLDAEDGRFPEFGSTYRAIREHHEFDEDGYRQLSLYAQERNLTFLCTPFDLESLRFLERIDLPAYKIASHSVTNLPLLEGVADTGKPVIMSSGMCTWDELDRAVDVMRAGGIPLALMHCVSSYPQPDEESNLGLIGALRDRYRIPVGYSGHELDYLATLVAVGLGASMVERHITLNSGMTGFDHKLSVEPETLIELLRNIRRVESMKLSTEKRVSEQEMKTRVKYHVSIVSECDISPGETITREMLTLKNPGSGLPATAFPNVIGGRAKVAIPADSLLSFKDLEGDEHIDNSGGNVKRVRA